MDLNRSDAELEIDFWLAAERLRAEARLLDRNDHTEAELLREKSAAMQEKSIHYAQLRAQAIEEHQIDLDDSKRVQQLHQDGRPMFNGRPM